ncbi:MAG: hypothetical protein P8I03_00175 [Thalassotalea sp.]|nr:hypothetical protein [Thalassotalea sp.]
MKTITVFIIFTFLSFQSFANKELLPREFLLNGIEEHYVNELIYLNETVILDEIVFCSFTFKPFKSCRSVNAKFFLLIPIDGTKPKNQTYGVEYIAGEMVERKMSIYEQLFIDKVLKYFNKIGDEYKKTSPIYKKLQEELEREKANKAALKEKLEHN